MSNKSLNKKIISFLIILLFLITPTSQCTTFTKTSAEKTCYGFVIPQSRNENCTIADQKNCKVRNMINDILREKIPVFWTATNITVKILEINSSEDEKNKNFEKGTFIVPFTGNDTKDKKITTIVYDYNQTSEIEIENKISIDIYIILEPINTEVLPLKDAKIAMFKNRVTVGESLFLKLLYKCGFLNYDIIWSEQINSKLNTEEYNLLIHAGGIFDTAPLLIHYVYEDIAYREADGVRAFIADGGGYIGSCGGLTKASAGGTLFEDIPIPIYLKRRVYNPKLRSIGVYAISDILIRPAIKTLKENQVKIVSNSSPVTYGLDKIVWDLHCGGPEVIEVGENTEVISRFYDTGTRFDGTPSWLSSNFGEGKVVIFVNHPEIAGIKDVVNHISMHNSGKTAISNSIFYTTASDKIIYEKTNSKNLTFIKDTWNVTKDLSESLKETESVFESIRTSMNETEDHMNYLSSNISKTISLIFDIAEKHDINLSSRENEYYLGIMYNHDILFYFNLLKGYQEKIFSILDKLERIYFLLKNDDDFIQKFEILKSNISERICEMKQILNETQNMINNYESELISYKNCRFRFKLREIKLKNNVMDIYLHVFQGFSLLPKNNFNSIKFIRHQWYDYETNTTC